MSSSGRVTSLSRDTEMASLRASNRIVKDILSKTDVQPLPLNQTLPNGQTLASFLIAQATKPKQK